MFLYVSRRVCQLPLTGLSAFLPGLCFPQLDDILLLFDYQLSRQTFLTMLLDIHPVKHAYHRYRGYDASSAQRTATLERGLEARLVFYETAMELVRQYGGKGGWMPEPGSVSDS